jgi:3-oxoacyl-[acyl-carrier-protein] synthase II
LEEEPARAESIGASGVDQRAVAAAGAISGRALRAPTQIAPPTANLVEVDPKCDLDFVPRAARPMAIRAAISNSFGFGGTNATIAFRAVPA